MKNKNKNNLPDSVAPVPSPAADNPPAMVPPPLGSAFKIDITYDPKLPRGQNNPGMSISPIGTKNINIDDVLEVLLLFRDMLIVEKERILKLQTKDIENPQTDKKPSEDSR